LRHVTQDLVAYVGALPVSRWIIIALPLVRFDRTAQHFLEAARRFTLGIRRPSIEVLSSTRRLICQPFSLVRTLSVTLPKVRLS
jgi:hypothetical protein